MHASTHTSGRRDPAGLWSRVLWLDGQLREGAYPGVAALRDEFSIARRTALETVAFLRDSLDAPLAYARSRQGYYYTDPTYALPTVFLQEGELLALLVAQEAARHYLGTPLEEPLRTALRKLSRSLPGAVSVELSEVADRLRMGGPSGPAVNRDLMLDLNRAMRERRVVRILYYTAGRDALGEREVEPHFLRNVRGDWMLVAWDRTRAADRVFMLSRIREWRLLDAAFQFRPELRPEVYDLHTFATDHGTAPREVVLRFDAYQARWIREREWHPSQQLEELPDGGVILRLRVAGEGDLLRWILGYGSHVEVLSPPDLRAKAAEDLRRAAELYE